MSDLPARNQCVKRAESLVEFADGELDAGERTELRAHLSECAECRARLAAIERSLALAQEEWSVALEARTAERRSWPARKSRSRVRFAGGHRKPAAWLAAAAASIFGLSLWLNQSINRNKPAAVDDRGLSARPAEVALQTPKTRTDDEPKSHAMYGLDDFEQQLSREQIAARLSALAAILETLPESRNSAAKTYALVVRAFPETEAGRLALAEHRRIPANQGDAP